MPSKIIYRLNLMNGDSLIELSKSRLKEKLKNYVLDRNLKKEGWFYLSDYKINKLFDNLRVSRCYHFIKSADKCSVEHYFKNRELPIENDCGMPYKESYRFFLKNKFYIDECKKLLSGTEPIDNKPFMDYIEPPKVIFINRNKILKKN